MRHQELGEHEKRCEQDPEGGQRVRREGRVLELFLVHDRVAIEHDPTRTRIVTLQLNVSERVVVSVASREARQPR